MKAKDVARQYGLDSNAFLTWLHSSGYETKSSFSGALEIVDGQDAEAIVAQFKADQADAKDQVERQKAEQEQTARDKQQALASMLITSGFNFDGYTVTKYSGYISGDDVTQIARDPKTWFTKGTGAYTRVGDNLSDALVQIRRNALAELKEAAWALGCNAVVGVDFDYLTLEPETQSRDGKAVLMPYVVCVTANGNAVVIEKTPRTGSA